MKVVDLNNLPGYQRLAKKQPETSSGMKMLGSFGNALKEALNNANDLQLNADDLMEKMATGEVDNLHSVMIGVTKAELALQFVMEIRNKLTELYKELMRMPV